MNSRERVLNRFAGKTVDRLPLMPITMQFACRMIGRKYKDYITDHKVLVQAQMRVVEAFGFTMFPAFPIRHARRPILAVR